MRLPIFSREMAQEQVLGPHDRPFFRCSGCPAQARMCDSSWLLMVASGRWWLPSLPSRLPSEISGPSASPAGSRTRPSDSARR